MELIEETKQLNEFLSNNEHQIFHTLTYKKFIEEAFGVKYQFVGVREKEKIKTILPIVQIKDKILGNKIVSSAYLEYGGFAGDEKHIPEIISFLNLEHKNKFDYLEIRGNGRFDSVLSSRLIKKNLYQRFVLELNSEEQVWRNIQKSKRKAIKKSGKYIEVRDVPFSELNDFYQLYCENMKSFGSPGYSKRYFRSFYRNIIDNRLGKILGGYYQGKLVSALLGFCYLDRIHILIAVSDPGLQEYRPNDAVHWEFIKWAIENDFKYFDFGRVRKESGQFEYKRKWGPELKELPSYFLLWKAKEVPIVDPSSHGLATKVWKRLPLSVTKLAGHRLRKGLGI